ncbi:MAG: Mfa1 family fimbria major subunit [Muribaculum sp.]|nr:Mfa1 family fimbria major subunit [Muribaculum sp.]
MKIISKILLGFTAFAFAACSSDEPVVNPVTPETPDGDVAYMAITISAPEGLGSRSTTDGEDYVPSWDVEDEHKVSTVDFYFFEADGTYAFNASATTDFDKSTSGTGANNVEYIGNKQILILNGVRQNDYPEYVITVINKPADFAPGQTMQETGEMLAEYANKKAFVMTTSSFFGDKALEAEGELRHDGKYFATKLNKSDFKTTVNEASTTTSPVQIYVERLDAKVQLNFSKADETKFETYNNETYYKISQTLAGGDNQTGTGTQSQVDLYVKVVGWGLNATAKKSYMSKQLDSTWETTAPQDNWAWNNAKDWRSFWAKAWTYGIGGENVNDSDKLTYITAQSVATSTLSTEDNDKNPNYDYCYENTNAPANIFADVDGGSLLLNNNEAAVKNGLATHVVLHTQIYQKDSEGKMVTAGELVQYRGVLYTGLSYKNLLLSRLQTKGTLNFWTLEGTSVTPENAQTSDWKTIDASFLATKRSERENHKLGEIEVTAKSKDGVTVYHYEVDPDDATKGEYKPYTAEEFEAALNNALAAVDDTDNPAVGSNGNSDAFYYIPVEHHALENETKAVEGYYGVVRNHWYKILVSSFKKAGHLVFEPETDTTQIIPEGPEDPLYYVGAKINILSWKVVNQSVTDL